MELDSVTQVIDRGGFKGQTNIDRAVPVPEKNKLKEFILDPSTGQYSMSRLCLGVVVLIFLPITLVLYTYHVNVPAAVIVSTVAALATVYAANSAAGAYGRSIFSSVSGSLGNENIGTRPSITPTKKIPEDRGEV